MATEKVLTEKELNKMMKHYKPIKFKYDGKYNNLDIKKIVEFCKEVGRLDEYKEVVEKLEPVFCDPKWKEITKDFVDGKISPFEEYKMKTEFFKEKCKEIFGDVES